MRKYTLIVTFALLVSPVFAQGLQFETGQPQRICSCEAMFDIRHHSNHHPFRPFVVVPCEHDYKSVAEVQNQPNWFDNFKRKRKVRRTKRNEERNVGGIIRPF